MGMILKELTDAAEPGEMVVQGIAQALAVHLVRQYGRRDSVLPARRGALPAFKLQKVVRMMEAGLDQGLQSRKAWLPKPSSAPFIFPASSSNRPARRPRIISSS